MKTLSLIWSNIWVYLGVKTCEVFLCFITIIFVLSIVLTFLFSLFYVTRERNRFYTEDEPNVFQLSAWDNCKLVGPSKPYL